MRRDEKDKCRSKDGMCAVQSLYGAKSRDQRDDERQRQRHPRDDAVCSVDGDIPAGLCGDKGSVPEAKRGVGLTGTGDLHRDDLHGLYDKAQKQQGT